VKGQLALAIFVLALACLACGRTKSETDPNGVAARAALGDASTAAPSVAPTGPTPTSPSSATVKTQWRGSYKSASGELYIPPDWKNVHWNVKETPAGLGEGSLTLSVDPANGRALGSLDGPLGPALVDGLVSAGKLTATITRKDPADQGFTGTLVGSIGPDHAEGTMSISLAEASAVRKATFTLSPEAAPR
jgi:hypothetical protein